MHFRHSQGSSRSSRPGSERRSYSAARPFQAPEAIADSHLGQPPAAGRRGAQDGHARLAAARVAGPVPPPGAGGVLELSAEGCAAAEAGHPRDAGVVQLGRGPRTSSPP